MSPTTHPVRTWLYSHAMRSGSAAGGILSRNLGVSSTSYRLETLKLSILLLDEFFEYGDLIGLADEFLFRIFFRELE